MTLDTVLHCAESSSTSCVLFTHRSFPQLAIALIHSHSFAMRPHEIYHPCGSRPRASIQVPVKDGSRGGRAVTSTTVSIPTHDGASVSAYLAIPEEIPDGARAGVALLSDIRGIENEHTKKVADLLASYSLPTSTYCTLTPLHSSITPVKK